MLRTELDALPVEEKTGLPYASKVHAKDDAGHDVPVMHACGHDLHMASLLGTAEIMAREQKYLAWNADADRPTRRGNHQRRRGNVARWLVHALSQARRCRGAARGNAVPAGMVSITPGIYNTNADSMRITIYGKGGHGSLPQTTIDPIVIAARTILALQTIVSREVKPGEMAVVTVGYIQAGTKNNIIPDHAEMGLTVRTYKHDVRKQMLAAITRITKAEAAAAGAPREPLVEHYEGADLVYNDPALAERLRAPLEAALGKDNVDDCRADHAVRRFLILRRAGSAGILFQPGRRRSGEIRAGEGRGNACCPRIIRRCSLPTWIRRYARESSRKSRCCGIC